MEMTLDIFKNNAFSTIQLQRTVDNAPYIPQTLGSMQIFEPKPIETLEVLLYEKDGGFALIPFSERGSPDVQQIRREGRIRALPTFRLSKKDTVRAGELTGIADKALPENIRIRNAMDLVNERTSQLKTDLEATKEYNRLNALQGYTLDADGSTRLNMFTQYGMSVPSVVNFNFSTIAAGTLAVYIQQNVRDPILDSLKQRKTPTTTVHALVGDTFWYSLIQHADVREIWKLEQQTRAITMAMNPLAQPPRYESITFGNVTFHHYEGSTAGEIDVGTNDAHFFPVGAKDVFCAYWAPGETLLDATGKGKPQYLYVQPDPNDQMPSYVDIVLRSQMLYACIYPAALLKGLRTG